jgi:hypothetical protein
MQCPSFMLFDLMCASFCHLFQVPWFRVLFAGCSENREIVTRLHSGGAVKSAVKPTAASRLRYRFALLGKQVAATSSYLKEAGETYVISRLCLLCTGRGC